MKTILVEHASDINSDKQYSMQVFVGKYILPILPN